MKDIGKKLMDIARWYSMPADHFNTIKEAVELLEQKPKKPSYNSVKNELKQKCDRINSLASVLPYAPHREIQELLCEIMDLCKAESEGKE